MKITIFLLIVVVLLVAIGTASAANITIGSDKFLTVNGTKMFVMGIYNICEQTMDTYEDYPDCETALEMFDNYTLSVVTLKGDSLYYYDATMPLFANAGIYSDVFTSWTNLGSRVNDPYFWGHYISPDERTTVSEYQQTINTYNTIKTFDPDNIVYTSYLYMKAQDGYSPYTPINYTDILMEAGYSSRTNCGSSIYSYANPPTCTIVAWHIDDYLYEREQTFRLYSLDGSSDGSGLGTVEELPDPVFIGEATPGNEYHEGDMIQPVISPQKLRAETYWALTIGATGTFHWGAKWTCHDGDNVTNDPNNCGAALSINTTASKYFNDFAGEIKGDEMRTIITLPTIAYSWNYYKDWDSTVTFDNNPSCSNCADVGTGYALTYRLKYDSTTGNYYLIVVNKDPDPLTTNITISGISANAIATTKGITGTGSSAPGRVLTVTNGIFTDSFDGYGAHVYEIGSSSPAPIITSWSNTKTNNASTSFAVNSTELLTFSTTPDQTITSWIWTNGGQSAGNGTGSYRTSWNTGGTRTVTVYGSNAIGSTQTITWNIYVNPTSNTDPKIGYGGVPFSSDNSILEHTTVNKGDSKVTVGILADNFNDGTEDWSKIGTWSTVNGKYVHTGTDTTTRAWYEVPTYSDAMIFIQMNESALNNNMDAGNLRGDTSRASTDMLYQFSIRPDGTGAHINYYDGVNWPGVNNTGTFVRSANVDNYYIVSVSGTNFKGYASTNSFADAWNNLRSSGTDSTYSSGNKIGFGGDFGTGNVISVDNFRAIQMVSGNPRTYGSVNSNYNAGSGNVTRNITINATTPANTNYTVSYRQKFTGSWVSIGGTYTGNKTISIPDPKYQETEVNITLYGNTTSFPDIETVIFITDQEEESLPVKIFSRYDVDENGFVDISDLSLVSQHFNENVSSPYPRYDVNENGLVDIEDITIVGQHFDENI